MIRTASLALAATLFTAVASAQTAPALPPPPPAAPAVAQEGFTLDDAAAAMRRSHPLLAAARSTVRASDGDVVAAGLWTNPVLGATYTRSVGFTTYDPVVGVPQVGVTQFIETAGLPAARRHAAEFNREALRSDARGVELGLMFDLRAAAVALAEAEARVRVQREAFDDLTSAANVVRSRVNAGAAPRYDASRIVIAQADAEASLADAEADALRARADLDVAVGPGASALRGSLRFDLETTPDLPSVERLVGQVSARPDLVAAERRATAQRAQVEVARRAVFQGVSVYAGAVYGAGADDNPDHHQVDLMLGLSLPLPVIDRGQGTIPAAQGRADAARSVFDALSLAARQRVHAAWQEVDRRRRALAAWHLAGTSELREMRHEAEVGYREGRLSILELVDAYTSFRDARLRGLGLASDARAAEVLLGRAVGVALTGAAPLQ
jgi:outer membrane protein, heavy metal efflux system